MSETRDWRNKWAHQATISSDDAYRALAARPKRFHSAAMLAPSRMGRDAGRLAEEVIAHLAGLVGATVRVSIEIHADIPNGAPDQVVRTVTENSSTLKVQGGFEKE